MTTEQMAALKEVAEKAAEKQSGPWEREDSEHVDSGVTLKYRSVRTYPQYQVPTGYGGISMQTNYPDDTPQGEQANCYMDHIATFDPTTCLALLEEVERLTKENAELTGRIANALI